MGKYINIVKSLLIMITIFIVIQGGLMLTVYGFSMWFFLIVLTEVLMLIAQFILLKIKTYPKWFDVVYLLPFPLIYIITLFG